MLRFPPATTSVLWPPNSILTAALLLTPIRRWWVCLAGALPVHFLIQSSLGWPVALVGTLFLTNCSEALIAAGFIRAFSDAPLRFDTFRRVVVFIIGAGLLAPLLSSFADAAVVHAFRGEPFWVVLQTRLFANSLTELSVVPLVVLGRCARRRPYLEISHAARFLEGGAARLRFRRGSAVHLRPRQARPRASGFDFYAAVLMLPLFFWAALRFGAGGMSAALLMVALTASFAARTGNRPFAVSIPNESLLAVQLYLVIMAIPLYAVSALLDERRRAMSELARGLQFEALLSELSRSFVRTPSDRIGEAFDVCLRRAGEFFGVDRVAIMQLSRSGTHLLIFRQGSAEGVPLLPDSYSCDMFPWVVDRLLSSEEVICESIDDMPKDADQDRASFSKLGLRAAFVIPLVASGNVQGVMSLHMIRTAQSLARSRSWRRSG